MIENIQIKPQNEALDVRNSKKVVSRSLKVIKGQKSAKKVKVRTLSKVYNQYVKMKLLWWAFQNRENETSK